MSVKKIVFFSLFAIFSNTVFAQIKLNITGLEKQIETQSSQRNKIKHSEFYDLNLDGKPDVAIQFVKTIYDQIRFLVRDSVYGMYDVYDPEYFSVNDPAGLNVDWDVRATDANGNPARTSAEIEYFTGSLNNYSYIVPPPEVAQRLPAFLNYLQIQTLRKNE